MKRKIFVLSLAIVMCLCLILGLVACGSDNGNSSESSEESSIDGVYYLYTSEELDQQNYVRLTNNTFSMNFGNYVCEGSYTLSGTSVTLSVAGDEGPEFYGSVEEGKLTLTIADDEFVFYQTGKEPVHIVPDSYTVTFHACGGTFDEEEPTETLTLVVDRGESVELPTPPVRLSYEFAGWSTSDEEFAEFDKYEPIEENLDLYASWELAEGEYELLFYLTSDSDPIRRATVNGFVNYTPEREGYFFNGWWLSNGNKDDDGNYILTSKWNVSNKVTGQMSLYAAWLAEENALRALPAPSVSLDGDLFTWEAVDGAVNYEIGYRLGSDEDYTTRTTTDTKWQFPSNLEMGTYDIRIRARGDGVNTVNSRYTTCSFQNLYLARTSISFNQAEDTLVWTPVSHAQSYQLSVDGKTIDSYFASSSRLAFDMSDYEAGSHSVSITTSSYGYISSETIYTFAKLRIKTPSVKAYIVNDEYVIGWDSVLYADAYEISINGEAPITTQNNYYRLPFTLAAWSNGDDANKITVDVRAVNSPHDWIRSELTQTLTLARLYDLSLSSLDAANLTVRGVMPTPLKYEVTFDKNSQYTVWSMPSKQTVSEQSPLKYPRYIPTCDLSNIVFTGWYTEPECLNRYDFSSEVTRDLTLYAGWFAIDGVNTTYFDIRSYQTESNSCYHSTSGTSSSKPSYYSFTALTSGSYTFHYKNGTSGSSYATSFSIYNVTEKRSMLSSSTTSSSYSTLSFTAVAGDVYYVNIYHSGSSSYYNTFYYYFTGDIDPEDGGSVADAKILKEGTSALGASIPFGQDVTITAPSQSSTGAAFLGWYEGNNIISNDRQFTFAMPACDTVYFARYQGEYYVSVSEQTGGSIYRIATSVSVSFDLNGASGTAPSTQVITQSTSLVYPEIPTRSGSYLFGGWYTDSACTGEPFDFSADILEDVKLYAKWVSYSGNGTIALNGSLQVYAYGESSGSSSNGYYAFVPLVSGEIEIHSSASFDTKGYLYDSGKIQLEYDDDDYGSRQFQIKYQVEAGKLYYIKVTGYSSNSGNVTVYLNGALPTAGAKVPSSSTVWIGDILWAKAGDEITLTAVPAFGYEFAGWYDGDDSNVCETAEYTFTMPEEDKELTLHFRSTEE